MASEIPAGDVAGTNPRRSTPLNPMKKLLGVAATVVAAVLFATAPAGANGSPLEQSAELTADCGQVTLTLVNGHEHATHDFTYVWAVRTSDGTTEDVAVANSDSPVTHEVNLEPGDGNGWVSFGVVAGPESNYYLAFSTISVPLCEPEPDSTTSTTEGDETPGDDEDDETPGDEQPGDEQPGDEQPGDEQPGDEQPGNEQPDDEQADTSGTTPDQTVEDTDTAPEDADGGAPEYQNCADVAAHRSVPILVGEPGFSERLDADRDGIGCEIGEAAIEIAAGSARGGELPHTGSNSTRALLTAGTGLVLIGGGLFLARRLIQQRRTA